MDFKPLKKAATFWAAYWGLLSVYILTLFVDSDIAATIAVPIVAALVSLSGISQASNIIADDLKAKNYVPEMDKEKECVQKDC